MVGVVQAGRLVAFGPKDEVLQPGRTIRLYGVVRYN